MHKRNHEQMELLRGNTYCEAAPVWRATDDWFEDERKSMEFSTMALNLEFFARICFWLVCFACIYSESSIELSAIFSTVSSLPDFLVKQLQRIDWNIQSNFALTTRYLTLFFLILVCWFALIERAKPTHFFQFAQLAFAGMFFFIIETPAPRTHSVCATIKKTKIALWFHHK